MIEHAKYRENYEFQRACVKGYTTEALEETIRVLEQRVTHPKPGDEHFSYNPARSWPGVVYWRACKEELAKRVPPLIEEMHEMQAYDA
jgi:hypothetical protein